MPPQQIRSRRRRRRSTYPPPHRPAPARGAPGPAVTASACAGWVLFLVAVMVWALLGGGLTLRLAVGVWAGVLLGAVLAMLGAALEREGRQ